MSILIKGMEMPQNCYTCNLCNYYNEPNQGCYCVTLRADLHSTDIMKERAKNCPLVELPPHGRLIDADALEELFREVIGNIAKRKEMEPVLEHMVRASAMVIEMIDDAPTIIEAEGRVNHENQNNRN